MQHSIVPDGHGLGLAGSWHAARPVIGRHRSPDPAPSPRRLAIALLAGLVALGCGTWLAFTHSERSARSASTAAATQSAGGAVTDWIRANVPVGTRLLTDGATPPAGYPAVSLTAAGVDWRNYSYLMTTNAATTPAPDSVLTTVWNSSTSVAIFDDIQIRRILALIPPEQIQRNRDADRADRLRAGEALNVNPRLSASPNAASILARGELDLRAAIVLAALTAELPVTLDDVHLVAAEAAAGIPARSIAIYVSDPARAARVLSAISTPLAPDRVDVGENGAIRAQWPLSLTPIPSVN